MTSMMDWYQQNDTNYGIGTNKIEPPFIKTGNGLNAQATLSARAPDPPARYGVRRDPEKGALPVSLKTSRDFCSSRSRCSRREYKIEDAK